MNGQRFPLISPAAARRFVSECYGVQGECAPLPGDRDQNFKVTVDGVARFVLKVIHPDEDRARLRAQHDAMNHVARDGTVRTPVVERTTRGEELAALDGCPARLVRFVEGHVLAQAVPRPFDDDLLVSIGVAVGRLTRALHGVTLDRVWDAGKWDLRHWRATLASRLPLIDEPNHRRLLERFCARFDQSPGDRLSALRRSVVHNDANDYNLIADRVDDRWTVVGIIDFGDLAHTATVSEPAIAGAYALLDQPDPLHAAGRVVAGYETVSPLTAPERNVMFDLICLRLCLSVTICAEQKRADPGNEYLAISERPAWTALERLSRYDPDRAGTAIVGGAG